jgi:hypothetical protein
MTHANKQARSASEAIERNAAAGRNSAICVGWPATGWHALEGREFGNCNLNGS